MKESQDGDREGTRTNVFAQGGVERAVRLAAPAGIEWSRTECLDREPC
jgi:hypothetical protein